MSADRRPLLAVELAGAGRHPAAWRWRDAAPADLFTGHRHAALAQLTDQAGFDLLVLDGRIAPTAPRAVSGVLDALALAARVAPETERVTVVGVQELPDPDPSSLAEPLTALDAVSGGRAGWQPHPASGSIASVRARVPPRLLIVLPTDRVEWQVLAAEADVVRVRADDLAAARAARDRIRTAVAAAGRNPDRVPVLLDLEVLLSGHDGVSRTVLERLDLFADTAYRPSSLAVIGTASGLADLVEQAWQDGAVDGVTLCPLRVPADLRALTSEALPLLGRRGLLAPAPRRTVAP